MGFAALQARGLGLGALPASCGRWERTNKRQARRYFCVFFLTSRPPCFVSLLETDRLLPSDFASRRLCLALCLIPLYKSAGSLCFCIFSVLF